MRESGQGCSHFSDRTSLALSRVGKSTPAICSFRVNEYRTLLTRFFTTVTGMSLFPLDISPSAHSRMSAGSVSNRLPIITNCPECIKYPPLPQNA
jgi:hypothetical protein